MCIETALRMFSDRKEPKIFNKNGELTIYGLKLYNKLKSCLRQLMFAGIPDMTIKNVYNIMWDIDNIIDSYGN